MEDLAWNPIYMNTQNWHEIWCNPFLPRSNSLLQCSLWIVFNFKIQFRVCATITAGLLREVLPIVFPLHRNYCLDIAPCFREPLFQASSDCRCLHLAAYYQVGPGSSEAGAAYGLSSLRSLDGFACVDLTFRTWTRPEGDMALNLEQHWPQVVV